MVSEYHCKKGQPTFDREETCCKPWQFTTDKTNKSR